MLSEKKSFLRLAEFIAIAGAMAAICLAVQSYIFPNPDFPLFVASFVGMAVLLLTFLPACMLGAEYIRTVRKPTTWREKTEGLNASELQAIVHWSPKAYVLAACAGVLIAVATALKFGSITYSEGQAVNPGDVTGLSLYFSIFFLLALPVLGSAARMPGPYGERDA